MSLLQIATKIEAVPGVLHDAMGGATQGAGVGGDGTPDPLSPGIIACREITKDRATNFYLGLSLAPEPKRSALLALYAWMREADDLADAAGPGDTGTTRVRALDGFAERTRQILARRGGGACVEGSPGSLAAYEGLGDRSVRPSPTRANHEWDGNWRGGADAGVAGRERGSWWDGFAAMVSACPVPASVFVDTLEALRRDAKADVEAVDVGTVEELAWYADHVAGTVAIACVSIWGLRGRGIRASAAESARAGRLAVLRGRAVQVTNILRDVREDIAGKNPRGERRSYLPRESYERHGLTPEDLLAWSNAERCERFVAEWTREASRLFEASAELESVIDPSCARVSWALSAMYRALLDKMRRDPGRVVRERVRVGARRKLGIAVRGYLGVGLPG